MDGYGRIAVPSDAANVWMSEMELVTLFDVICPATRAAVIETLFARGYIRREKKSLVPTDKGMAVHETVKDKKIANVEMTAAWEDTLARIESRAFFFLPLAPLPEIIPPHQSVPA